MNVPASGDRCSSDRLSDGGEETRGAAAAPGTYRGRVFCRSRDDERSAEGPWSVYRSWGDDMTWQPVGARHSTKRLLLALKKGLFEKDFDDMHFVFKLPVLHKKVLFITLCHPNAPYS